MTRILVVDDDTGSCSFLIKLLEKEGFETAAKNTPSEALALFRDNPFDLVITDFYMPGMNGLELLQEIKKTDTGADVIMMTAYASVDNAVEAMRKGAYDYIVKPFQADDLLLSVRRVLEKRRLAEENRFLREELEKKYGFHNIMGRAPSMQKLFSSIKKVADSEATVLLIGESGTGKELVSKAVHYAGRRKNKNFVAVNCSALPDTLLESELFGHVKGAFTGATENKQGLLEYADGGTLFLDEIADTSPAVQAKLLRVMQDKKIRKLGDNREIEVDIRIITATSKDLRKLIEEKTFREDLFYRINVFPITVPSLRERKEDIPLLVEHFLKGRKRMHPAVLDALMDYGWPGNVRELENMVERLVVFASGETVTPEDLPSDTPDMSLGKIAPNVPYTEARGRILDEFTKSFIGRALQQTGGNVTRASEIAGLDRANFQRLMRRHRVDPSQYKQ